jgi:hypothetical protein
MQTLYGCSLRLSTCIELQFEVASLLNIRGQHLIFISMWMASKVNSFLWDTKKIDLTSFNKSINYTASKESKDTVDTDDEGQTNIWALLGQTVV